MQQPKPIPSPDKGQNNTKRKEVPRGANGGEERKEKDIDWNCAEQEFFDLAAEDRRIILEIIGGE